LNSNREIIGLVLKQLRVEKGISLENLSYDLDIDKKYYWMIEKGRANFSMNKLEIILKYFKISQKNFFIKVDKFS
tara:strand:+ start:952 stop:1176 length:225 start_codon:yes stop_codon:yes gene_type:complete